MGDLLRLERAPERHLGDEHGLRLLLVAVGLAVQLEIATAAGAEKCSLGASITVWGYSCGS